MEQNYERGLGIPSENLEDKPEDYVQNSELKQILADAINKLPEKEKTVISFYYLEELTLKEISAIMNVTESRISQLHTKALLRMRGKLGRHKIMLEA